MSANTSISWTHHTFNPWSGCAKISAGCTNCYAANLPPAMRRHAVWGEGGERIPASESYWRQPLTWDRAAAKLGKRHRVFCASVADVFEAREDLDAWRDRLMALIALTPNLDWQLLTKRPEYAASYLSRPDLYRRILDAAPFFRFTPGSGGIRRASDRMGIGISDPTDLATWWPNLWIGTSVEDQRAADERSPHLLKIPVRVRFLSMEPLLGPVDLGAIPVEDMRPICGWTQTPENARPKGPAHVNVLSGLTDTGHTLKSTINWVIVGGESGHKARPMNPAWARSIRDQCVAAGVPFHFKQWGEWTPEISGIDLNDADDKNAVHRFDDEEIVVRVGKHNAGRLLDGRTWDQLPEAT